MIYPTYIKNLSANDVGETGAHQGGILIPKTDLDLLAFLPALDPAILNPDAWLNCTDETGTHRRFRFVYYNNKLHMKKGTRNEYRITHMTKYFREVASHSGDIFEISRRGDEQFYRTRLIAHSEQPSKVKTDDENGVRIKIRSSWHRIH